MASNVNAHIHLDAQQRPVRDLPLPMLEAAFPRQRPVPDPAGAATPPTAEECAALWDKYATPPHIRAHCSQVAHIVTTLGKRLQELGARLDPALLLAGALLHDLAKAYTIEFNGNHAQLGAAWALQETGHVRVAQMVFHHVHWPWVLDVYNESMLPCLLLVYADKRVKHDTIVPLDERFEDLMLRYGRNDRSRLFINSSLEQGRDLERVLAERLGEDLNAYSFDSRGLV